MVGTSTNAAQVVNNVSAETSAGVSTIAKPAANQHIEFEVESGHAYVFAFTQSEVLSTAQDGNDLVITFKDHSVLVLKDFVLAYAGMTPASIVFSDDLPFEPSGIVIKVVDTTPDGDMNMAEMALKLAGIAPAAGGVSEAPAATGPGDLQNSGFTFTDPQSAEAIAELNPIGPINPTMLGYGFGQALDQTLFLPTPVDDVPQISTVRVALDETNINPGGVSQDTHLSFGADAPGTLVADNSFLASGSLLSGNLTSGGVPVVVTSTPAGYVGMAGGTIIFELALDPVHVGEFTFTQYEALDHNNPSNPNDVITLDFGIVATDADGDITRSHIIIDVSDDAPVVTPMVENIDESLLAAGPIVVNDVLNFGFGNDGAGSVVPSGVTSFVGAPALTSGGQVVTVVTTPTGYTGTINGGATTVFSVVINPVTGATTYTQNLGLDHAPGSAGISLVLGVNVLDFDGDATASTITVNLSDAVPVIAVPANGTGLGTVDESAFPGVVSVNGILNVNFNGDTPGTIMPNGVTSSSVPLTSGGLPVTIAQVAGGYTGTINGGATNVFTLTLNPATGAYVFTQLRPLDHPNGADPNDAITITLGVVATDVDGDTDTDAITITVLDDGPVAVNDAATVLQNTVSIGGNLLANDIVGADVAGKITNVSFGGVGHAVAPAGTTSIAGTHGTLVIDANGTYTYTSSGTNVGPVTDQFAYTMRDSDGDTSSALLNVNIQDGVPVIAVPANGTGLGTVDESNLPAGASVSGTLNVNYNGDTPVGVTPNGVTSSSVPLTSGGLPVTIAQVAGGYTGTINGGATTVFTLTLNPASGAYVFTQVRPLDHPNAADPNDAITITLGVVATDVDGDTDTDAITITVLDDGPVVVNDAAMVLQGTLSVAGNILTNDTVGADTAGKITSVSFGGVPHAVAPAGTTSIAGTHGTLVIDANGVYTYTSLNTNLDPVSDQFTYTMRDADGDTSNALLNVGIQALAPPQLLVGSNVNNIVGEPTPWPVGGGTGPLVGDGSNGFIIGDIGGSVGVNQQGDHNILFIVDESGSMGALGDPNSRLFKLVAALDHLLTDLGSYTGGDILVHFTPFSSDAYAGATFTVTNPAGLAGAIAWLQTLGTNGLTNYEDALQDGITWLQSGALLPNAITSTYFLTDGEPNFYVGPAGTNIFTGDRAVAMGQITGADGTNEVAQIKALSDQVVGVGIALDATGLGRVAVVDSDGVPVNVFNPDDLDATLLQISPLNQLAAVGGDTINGNAGDDIIYGDSVNTDLLAVAQGLATAAGSGWDVYARLEAGQGTNAAWSRTDTLNYITSHAVEMGQESVDAQNQGRLGGDDTINGGTGNDIIFGQEGHDHITGGAGNDVLYGGSGNDVFIFTALTDGVDTIKDFNLGEGDVLDVSALLQGYDALQDNINTFVFKTEVGGNTIVSVDAAGSGNVGAAVQIAVLESATGLDLTLLTNDGNAVA